MGYRNIPGKISSITDPDTVIRLDMEMGNDKITITRSISSRKILLYVKNGQEINFDNIDDASEYLGNLYFEAYPSYIERIGFRTLLGPIIRNEKSEFKDIIKCYDTDKNISLDSGHTCSSLDLDWMCTLNCKK